MKKSTTELTVFAKIIIFLLIAALVAGGVLFAKKKFFNKSVTEDVKMIASESETEVHSTRETENIPIKEDVSNVINLSLDEWIGWKSMIDANGGLTTQPGSIYDELGIKVNIHVMNDATQSSNALISGDLNAAGYTINRLAFLGDKFKSAGKEVVMPYITNYSNGGDGIIAKSNISNINDLVGAKIGVPEFSEAQTLVVWFVENSDLTDAEKKEIENNLILMGDCDETAKAFFAGQIDAAATWQPYLTQAQNMSDAHILFDTSASSSLVMDGIVFDAEWAKENSETVSKFIEGSLKAASMYDTEFDYIREVLPMYSNASDEDIIGDSNSAKLATYNDNVKLLNDVARSIYTDMCDVWSIIGESTDKSRVDSIFDDTYVKSLSGKFTTTEQSKKEFKVTEEKKAEIVEETVDTSLLSKSATVNFIINTAKFDNTAEATEALDDFIKIAKTLDGAIIKIEGNTDPNPISDPDDSLNKMLSEQRAETVKNYFIMNGISADRIVTVGNGSSNPMYPNDTEENKAKNRRTDISFFIIE